MQHNRPSRTICSAVRWLTYSCCLPVAYICDMCELLLPHRSYLRPAYMRLRRRCTSVAGALEYPEMTKQWLGTPADRAALLHKWVSCLGFKTMSLSQKCSADCTRGRLEL